MAMWFIYTCGIFNMICGSPDMMSCLCDTISELWVHARSPMGAQHAIEAALDQLSARQVRIEVMDKKCLAEARRHKSAGSKVLFRNKMLEHRRLQNQLQQLQKYRDNALVQMDALSNQEINETFIKAIRAVAAFKEPPKEDAIRAVEDMHDAMGKVQELTDLLSHPIGDEVTDEELDAEFMEFSSTETVVEPPKVQTVVTPSHAILVKPRQMELRTDGIFASG